MDGFNFPDVGAFQMSRVTNIDQSAIVTQPQYDHALYPAAGAQVLSFFQQPQGSGQTTALGGTVGTLKSLADTNMVAAGSMPSGNEMLVESIEVPFFPGSVSTANTYTVDNLTYFLAAASAVPTAQVDDVSTFYQSGVFNFKVLNIDQLTESPLGLFPPKTRTEVQGAIASNSATTSEVGFAKAFQSGRPYYLPGRVNLMPAVNFSVTMTWPGLVPMPSGFNARVGVRFDGFLLRATG